MTDICLTVLYVGIRDQEVAGSVPSVGCEGESRPCSLPGSCGFAGHRRHPLLYRHIPVPSRSHSILSPNSPFL